MIKIIGKAKAERDSLLSQVTAIKREVVRLRRERAELLVGNELNGNDLAVMRINETLHNARRVLSVFNRRSECLDFMIDYIEKEGNGND